MSITKSVAALIPGGANDSDESPAETEAESAGTDDAPAAGLFNCSSCGKTYISETMDTCPGCETTVESIPTEADLGMV